MMLKAISTNAEKRTMTIWLGLSKENIERLEEDKPISINLGEFNMPDINIVIMYGDTEEEIKSDLRLIKLAGSRRRVDNKD